MATVASNRKGSRRPGASELDRSPIRHEQSVGASLRTMSGADEVNPSVQEAKDTTLAPIANGANGNAPDAVSIGAATPPRVAARILLAIPAATSIALAVHLW